VSAPTTLTTDVHRLLDEAETVLREPYVARIPEMRARLDGPLRVAIAGKVKAGKSTLLNALVGENVAPTDASECTRVVTWYRNSHVYRVTAAMFEGPPVELRFRRTERALEVDLDGRPPETIQYLDVEWPSQRLQDVVLIDTPGLASISDDVSRRTERFLASDEEGPGDADAVIYLLRHLHPMDLSFLEAFRDTTATSGAVNSIAVLSRADEIGSSRTNALQAAAMVAERYRTDPRIDSLCQVVVPVVGLIAQAAATLREDEAAIIRRIAAMPRDAVTDLLLSAQRFVSPDAPGGIDPDARQALLDRLGLFGVRLAVELTIAGRVTSTSELGTELELRSGIHELRELLAGQFTSRAAVLKARSALATVSALAELHGGSAGRRLRELAQDIENADHQLVEIRLLSQLKSDPSLLRGDDAEARRILGGDGPDAHLRLGMAPNASATAIRDAAVAAIGRWRVLAEDPLMSREGRTVAAGVIRTCEGLAVTSG
jgi:predicted GTPase